MYSDDPFERLMGDVYGARPTADVLARAVTPDGEDSLILLKEASVVLEHAIDEPLIVGGMGPLRHVYQLRVTTTNGITVYRPSGIVAPAGLIEGGKR